MSYTRVPTEKEGVWKYTFASERYPNRYENYVIELPKTAFETYNKRCPEISYTSEDWIPELSSHLIYGGGLEEIGDRYVQVDDLPSSWGVFTGNFFITLMDAPKKIYAKCMKMIGEYAVRLMNFTALKEFVPKFEIPDYSETSIIWFEVMDNICEAIRCLIENDTFVNHECPALNEMFVIEKVPEDQIWEVGRREEMGKDIEEVWNRAIDFISEYIGLELRGF